jgi:hypothetical protein
MTPGRNLVREIQRERTKDIPYAAATIYPQPDGTCPLATLLNTSVSTHTALGSVPQFEEIRPRLCAGSVASVTWWGCASGVQGEHRVCHGVVGGLGVSSEVTHGVDKGRGGRKV